MTERGMLRRMPQQFRKGTSMSRYATLLAALAFTAILPQAALTGSGEVPPDARARASGTGWDCLPGYLQSENICREIKRPKNAYLTGNSYGSGWACRRGYREVGNACQPIAVPTNENTNTVTVIRNRFIECPVIARPFQTRICT